MTMECEYYDSVKCDKHNDETSQQNEADTSPECGETLQCKADEVCYTVWLDEPFEQQATPPQPVLNASESQTRKQSRGHRSGLQVKRMGCLPQDNNCVWKNECRDESGKEHKFCCCKVSMCNSNFTYVPPVAENTTSPNSPGSGQLKPAGDPGTLLLGILVPVAIIIIFIVGVIFYVRRKRKQDREMLENGTDELGRGRALDKINDSDFLDTDVELESPPKYRGRFSTVYRGILKSNNTSVAVKIFEPANRESWKAEKEIYHLPRMNHDNILQFIGVLHKNATGTPHDCEYWLMTKFHNNGSLCDYLKSHTVTFAELRKIAHSMSAGLAYLHEELPIKGVDDLKPAVAHRDFKSKNVLIKDDLTACIGDFGLAMIFEPGRPCGDTHAQVGTARYMAPEVLELAITFTRDSFLHIDVYACGLVLWELASRCSIPGLPEPGEFKMAFAEELGDRQCSVSVMRELVVEEKMRPHIPEAWASNSALRELARTIQDCWDQDAEARLSASTVKERILASPSEGTTATLFIANERRSRAVDDEYELSPLIESNGHAHATTVPPNRQC